MKDTPISQFHEKTMQLPSLSKRNTLKAIAGLTASGALASIPGLASVQHTKNSLGQNSVLPIEGMLVSIPDIAGETLILKNKTNENIQIDQFAVSTIVFDGETVDCNVACESSAINIAARSNILIRFNSTSHEPNHPRTGEFLQLDKHMYRLPAGTRVVPLSAKMHGNIAVLTEKA